MKRINKKGEVVGKSYATRKEKTKRPESDFYSTPISLVWELLKTGVLDGVKTILEPCCGEKAISNQLEARGYIVTSKDIKTGNDFLLDEYDYGSYDAIVTNPPFSLWTEIIEKAKKTSPLVVAIGKTNFFGVHSRNNNDFWRHLKEIYIFDRQVDYQSPFRQDGLFCVGCLVTAWFVWDMNYNGNPEIKFIDVNKYAKLGSYKNYIKKNTKD